MEAKGNEIITELGNMKFFLNGQISINKAPILLVVTNLFNIGLTILATYIL